VATQTAPKGGVLFFESLFFPSTLTCTSALWCGCCALSLSRLAGLDQADGAVPVCPVAGCGAVLSCSDFLLIVGAERYAEVACAQAARCVVVPARPASRKGKRSVREAAAAAATTAPVHAPEVITLKVVLDRLAGLYTKLISSKQSRKRSKKASPSKTAWSKGIGFGGSATTTTSMVAQVKKATVREAEGDAVLTGVFNELLAALPPAAASPEHLLAVQHALHSSSLDVLLTLLLRNDSLLDITTSRAELYVCSRSTMPACLPPARVCSRRAPQTASGCLRNVCGLSERPRTARSAPSLFATADAACSCLGGRRYAATAGVVARLAEGPVAIGLLEDGCPVRHAIRSACDRQAPGSKRKVATDTTATSSDDTAGTSVNGLLRTVARQCKIFVRQCKGGSGSLEEADPLGVVTQLQRLPETIQVLFCLPHSHYHHRRLSSFWGLWGVDLCAQTSSGSCLACTLLSRLHVLVLTIFHR
jgi:hypothetical protein